MDIISVSASARVVDRHIRTIFKEKPDLITFFVKHPNRHLLEEALTRGLQGADSRKLLKSGPEYIDQVSKEIVSFWCRTVLDQHVANQRSHAEKRRIEDEGRRVEIARDIVRDIAPNIDDEDDFAVEEL